MSASLDRCDVAPISAEALDIPMQHMIAAGRGLVLLRGIADRELRDVEHAVWDKIEGSSAEKVATLLRFRCLVAVFKCSRLQELFLRRGLALFAPAIAVAAEMRLNVQYGFNPVKFTRALEEQLGESDNERSARRLQRAGTEMQAAATA
jgi:hypothetical protein